MSNTRRAKDSSVFRQERYASSTAYETALNGNLVAKRARLVESAEDRALLYWLQQKSHSEGGLLKLVKKIRKEFPDRIGTETMFKLGKSVSDHYGEDEIRKIRKELPGKSGMVSFPLNGDPVKVLDDWEEILANPNKPSAPIEYRQDCPSEYSVKRFKEACEFYNEEMAAYLAKLCLDPEISFVDEHGSTLAGVWNFHDLIGTLRELMRREALDAESEIVSTDISNQVYEDIDYALKTKSFVIIEGLERMGKSVTARNFCRRHPGKAIYIRLESGTDEKTFFRSIARAIGTSSSSQLKAIDIRIKIQDMLQQGDIMLVIDEAHFLWPQSNRSRTAPKRIDWLRTALVDYDVPVVIISTPQFTKQCEHHEGAVGWNARQIQGRVALHRILPTELSDNDLAAIARHKLPGADKQTIDLFRATASAKEDYVATIERIVKRATFFAEQSGRCSPGRDEIRRAVTEMIPPVVSSGTPQPKVKSAREKPTTTPMQSNCRKPARAQQNRLKCDTQPVKRGRINTLVAK